MIIKLLKLFETNFRSFFIQHSTLNTQHSTFNTQHSTFNIQHSLFRPRLAQIFEDGGYLAGREILAMLLVA